MLYYSFKPGQSAGDERMKPARIMTADAGLRIRA
jgi:hypothetical protein